jgi:FMN phosphatase YigB (HAD superfamily)
VTPTLLLDLDGTLLGNDVDRFVAVYTRALAGHLAPWVEPGLLVSTLNAATRAMLTQQSPAATLQETFDAAFYPALGLERQAIRGVIDAFYAGVFPTLQSYTRVLPEAVRFADEAVRRGIRLAIATNPLFPRTAIEQRLAWAGLSPQKYPFAIIPSYETFHFAKPHPAYFAELLSLLGWPEGPVVMVGNDLEADINGACLMGLPSFLVASDGQKPSPSGRVPTASGRLEDLLPWLDATPPETLEPDTTLLSAVLATLQATPAVLPALAGRMPFERWAQRPQRSEWSLTEILCHLRDVEAEVNLDRFQKIAWEDNPFLPGMDTDPWAESRRYIQQNGLHAQWDFIDSRLKVLSLFEGLPPVAWQRPARHAIFGPTHLQELAGIAAGHDRLHIQQIHQLLGRLAVDR